MNPLFEGIGVVLKKVGTYIPTKTERLKNERQKILDEMHEILKLENSAINDAKLKRLDDRLLKINRELINKTTD